MHIGSRLFDRAQQIAIVVRVQIAWQAPLHAHFARAQLPRFERTALNLFERVKISVLLARRAAEGAEATPDETDISEVDVAIDNVGDHIADAFAAHQVGSEDQGLHLVAASASKRQPFVEVKLATGERFIQQQGYRRIDLREQSIQPAGFVPMNVVNSVHQYSHQKPSSAFSRIYSDEGSSTSPQISTCLG